MKNNETQAQPQVVYLYKTNPIWLALVFIIGVFVGMIYLGEKDLNKELMYGKTGLPKNCRAIIRENYIGWQLDDYTPEEALDSINRNCGEFGYSWDIKE